MYSYVLKQFELDSTLHPPPLFWDGGEGEGGRSSFCVLCFVFFCCMTPSLNPSLSLSLGREGRRAKSNPIQSYHIISPISPYPISHIPSSPVLACLVYGFYGLRFTVCAFFMLYRVREGWMVRLGFRIGGTVEGPIREGIGEGGEGRMLFHSKSQEMDG